MIYIDEKQVLESLEIETWMDITDTQFRRFISLTTAMSSDLHIRLIAQNPVLILHTTDFIQHLIRLYDSTFSIQPFRFVPIQEALSRLNQKIEAIRLDPEPSSSQIKTVADTQCVLCKLYAQVDRKAYLLFSRLLTGVISFVYEASISLTQLLLHFGAGIQRRWQTSQK